VTDTKPAEEPNLRKLLLAFDEEVENQLTLHGIYDILHYGWVDHETPDQNYVGHAMWQTAPPFTPDWTVLLQGGTIHYVPTQRDEALTRTGEDFMGTMTFARRSIGAALCYAAVKATDLMDDKPAFWHEYTTSLQWLYISTDRLQQFFATVFEVRGKQIKKTRERNEPLFKAMVNSLIEDDVLLKKLCPIVDELCKYQMERDRVVHRLATVMAERRISILIEQRNVALSGAGREIAVPTFEDLESATADIPDDDLSGPVEAMKNWYSLLVEASNLIFEMEYWVRSKAN